jgi:putative transposase
MGFPFIYSSNETFGVKRRSATPQFLMPKIRGLKPTATITLSLRDERLHFEGDVNSQAAERHSMVAPSFKTGTNGGRNRSVAERQLMISSTRTRIANKITNNVAERQLENKSELERGRSMSRTYTCLHYHCVFSTKNREKHLNHEIESRIWSYIGGIARENKMWPIRIGGFVEHLHLLLSIPPVLPLSKAMQLLKGGSSHWIKDTFPELRGFSWQDGYSAFTVSKSQLPEIDRYIHNQREHHRVKSFQEEYLAFLERHGIQYDERYLWD